MYLIMEKFIIHFLLIAYLLFLKMPIVEVGQTQNITRFVIMMDIVSGVNKL